MFSIIVCEFQGFHIGVTEDWDVALCSSFLVYWILEKGGSTFFKTLGSTRLTVQHYISEGQGLHYSLFKAILAEGCWMCEEAAI